jgi:uncharacterized protein YggE
MPGGLARMNRTALCLLVSVTFLTPGLRSQNIQVDKNNRTIAITTTGKASAEADIALVTVGFAIFAPDAATAYQQGSQLSNGILDAVKKLGVPDKAVASDDQKLAYTEFPEGDKSTSAQRTQKQFTLSQSWIVTTAAANAASVLHAAIEAGANESGAINWELTTRDALQAKAAEEALVHARAVATQMAAGLNAHLGALMYASNQTPISRLLSTVNTSMASLASTRSAPPPPLAIRPQQVEETATVYAVFAIE